MIYTIEKAFTTTVSSRDIHFIKYYCFLEKSFVKDVLLFWKPQSGGEKNVDG